MNSSSGFATTDLDRRCRRFEKLMLRARDSLSLPWAAPEELCVAGPPTAVDDSGDMVSSVGFQSGIGKVRVAIEGL